MNKKNIIILFIAITIFLVALAIFIYANSLDSKNNNQHITNTTANKSITESKQSKEPYFYDIEGNKLNLNDFSDKPIVLLLWKSDDSKSYDIINLFTKYYDNYKESIYFLAINVNEPDIDLEIIQNVSAAGFSIPMYFDTDLTLYDEYYYEKLPYIIFIEENGTIGKEIAETITEDSFLANLDLLSKNY